jgi:DNA-binding transcriptional regulator YiaG
MSPQEYHSARSTLGWTHAHVSHAIGVSPRTCYRYSTGEVTIPEPAARLLRLLVRFRLTQSTETFVELLREIATNGQR